MRVAPFCKSGQVLGILHRPDPQFATERACLQRRLCIPPIHLIILFDTRTADEISTARIKHEALLVVPVFHMTLEGRIANRALFSGNDRRLLDVEHHSTLECFVLDLFRILGFAHLRQLELEVELLLLEHETLDGAGVAALDLRCQLVPFGRQSHGIASLLPVVVPHADRASC